jgi:RND family efflux transporter MFP subunit
MLDRTRLCVVALAVLTCTVGFWIGPGLAAAVRRPAAAPQGAPGGQERTVAVEHPLKTRVARSLDVPATLEAFEQAEISARVSGYVAAVHADIGDAVLAGGPLLEIAVPDLEQERLEARARLEARRAELAAAEAGDLAAAQASVEQSERKLEVARSEAERKQVDRALAQRQLERRRKLFDDRAVTPEALEDAQSQHEAARTDGLVAAGRIRAAEADVVRARAGLEVARSAIRIAGSQVEIARASLGRVEAMVAHARITAPFDGVVARRSVDRGDLVQAGSAGGAPPLFVVQRIDRVRVYFSVPEVDQPFVSAGTKVRVKPYALPEKVADAAVTRVASALDPGTRTMRAEIDLPNPERTLLPGMYAQVTLEIDPRPDALTLPTKAVLAEGQAQYVYVVRDGRAARIEVSTGIDDGARVEIRSGLTESDSVVVAGQGSLEPGAPLRVATGSTSTGAGRTK